MKGQLSSISDKLGSLTSENGFHVEDTEPTVNGLDITPACIIGFAIRRMLDDEVRFMPLVKPQERRDGIDATNRYILGAGEACRSTGMPVHSGNVTSRVEMFSVTRQPIELSESSTYQTVIHPLVRTATATEAAAPATMQLTSPGSGSDRYVHNVWKHTRALNPESQEHPEEVQ